MLQLSYKPFSLSVKSNTSTALSYNVLVVSLSLGQFTGFGELPLKNEAEQINYIALLESKKNVITRYALIDLKRFEHFLEHLLPNAPALALGLAMAGTELMSKLQKTTVTALLNLPPSMHIRASYAIEMEADTPLQSSAIPAGITTLTLYINDSGSIDAIQALRLHNPQYTYRLYIAGVWVKEALLSLLEAATTLTVELIYFEQNILTVLPQSYLAQLPPAYLKVKRFSLPELQEIQKTYEGVLFKLHEWGNLQQIVAGIELTKHTGLQIAGIATQCSHLSHAVLLTLSSALDVVELRHFFTLNTPLATGITTDAGNYNLSSKRGFGVKFVGE